MYSQWWVCKWVVCITFGWYLCKSWGRTYLRVSALPPFALSTAMLHFPSLRCLWFHCVLKAFGYKRMEHSMVSRVMHRLFHPHWVSSERCWEFFVFHVLFVFIMEQSVPKTEWFQASVFSKSISWTYLQSYSPYLLVLQPVPNPQGHSAQPSAKALNLSSSLLPHL